MRLSIEERALAWALMTALLSLGVAWLVGKPIHMIAASSGAPDDAAFADIVVSPELADQGHEFFAMSCSQCHGDDAHGDEGPDLHHLAISNARIAATIKSGVKGQMPTFAKKYDDRQIAALVSYLRSLR